MGYHNPPVVCVKCGRLATWTFWASKDRQQPWIGPLCTGHYLDGVDEMKAWLESQYVELTVAE